MVATMSSFDKMLGWFPNTRQEWIEFIAVLLCLLMIAISEFELLPVG